MPRKLQIGLVALGVAAGAAFAQGTAPATAPSLPTTQISSSPAMQKLEGAAQHLRDSIQALSQKSPGPERDVAIAQAQQALQATQRAMGELPTDLRFHGAASTGDDYDHSVQAMMRAADQLRESIHAMATQPPGERRNQAIRDANRALLDTQVAMANAYDVTAFGPQTTVLGAGGARTITLDTSGAHCVRLGDMLGCK